MRKYHKSKGMPKDEFSAEHQADHLMWSRRHFLLTGGFAGLGTMLLNGMPVNSLFPTSLPAAFSPGNNILVLLKMFGGNDGLNMIFPHSDSAGNSAYLSYRPNISHKYGTDYTDTTLLSGFGQTDFAMPAVMSSLMPLWNEGNMAILHNVGYPKQDFSHFSSIDNWASAADNGFDPRINSGYMGRYLNQDFPAFNETPPTVPPALRIGYNADLVFKSPDNQQFELVFNDPNEFYRLAQYGKLYPTDDLGECPRDEEVEFLRQLTNNSLRYSQSVTQAYNGASSKATYPTNTASRLADQLKIVARLIKGRLGTKVYMVYIDGFDNHANQKSAHNRLLMNIADSVSAFFNDLKADGFDQGVSIMTFSEFGRTIRENGSAGTDHGNMSPMMLFGPGVKGGFYGTPINLDDPGLRGGSTRVYFEQQASIDFRTMYASVMEQWMCMESELVDYCLGKPYSRLPLFDTPCLGTPSGSNYNTILVGHEPNPSNDRMVDIKFTQLGSNQVRLYIKTLDGRLLATLHDAYTPKGSYTIPFDPQKWKIHPGEYLYQLDSAGKTFIRRINVF
ncbi:MAG: DUF1501 domain-containing protein [Saprospiraceae bacterium]|nr:DUF1501 domain-containing protein [Saprospiraceae bacterium]